MQTFRYTEDMIGTIGGKRPKLNVLGRPITTWPPLNRHLLDKRHYVVLPDVIDAPYVVEPAPRPALRIKKEADDAG